MKKILRTFLLILTFTCFAVLQIVGQVVGICGLDKIYGPEGAELYTPSFSIEKMKSSEEAYSFVQKLLYPIGLPIDFFLQECDRPACRNNVFASKDENATKIITYDNGLIDKLSFDSLHTVSLTYFAHEIGHHLAAHTLFLNEKKYKAAIDACDPFNPIYNEELCSSTFHKDYKLYLSKSRKQELEADRFAGYIMSLYGSEIKDVKKALSVLRHPIEDSDSTHPELSKRLKSIEAGYNLSKRKKQGENVSLREIKGSLIEINIPNLSHFERSKLLEEISNAITFKPINSITRQNDQLGSISGRLEVNADSSFEEEVVKYHGNEVSPFLIENENQFFKFCDHAIMYKYDNKVHFYANQAIHLKDDILKILLFKKSKNPEVIYRTKFNRDTVSLEELEIMFVEIYENGMKNTFEKLKNNSR